MDNTADVRPQKSETQSHEASRPQEPGAWHTRMPWIIFAWILLVVFSPGIVVLMFFAELSNNYQRTSFYITNYRRWPLDASVYFLFIPFTNLVIFYDFLYDILRNTPAALSATLFSLLNITYWGIVLWWVIEYPAADHSFARQWEIVRNFLMNL